MEELQDSIDVDKKDVEVDRDDKSELSDISETYINRRALDTSSSFRCRCTDIGYIEDTNRIGIKMKTVNIEFVVDLGVIDDEENNNLFMRFISDLPISVINKSSIDKRERFEVWLSKDLRRVGFSKDRRAYPINIQEKTTLSGKSENIIRDIRLYNLYKSTDGRKPGWRQPIDSFEQLDDNSFELRIDATESESLVWNLDLPYQVNIDVHPVARLIEEEGKGDPRNLEVNSYAYIVHKSDLDGNLKIVGLDSSEEWAIVTESSYNKWNPKSRTEGYSENQKNKIDSDELLIYIAFVIVLFVLSVQVFGLLV